MNNLIPNAVDKLCSRIFFFGTSFQGLKFYGIALENNKKKGYVATKKAKRDKNVIIIAN
jgi:hypothetical protein